MSEKEEKTQFQVFIKSEKEYPVVKASPRKVRQYNELAVRSTLVSDEIKRRICERMCWDAEEKICAEVPQDEYFVELASIIFIGAAEDLEKYGDEVDIDEIHGGNALFLARVNGTSGQQQKSSESLKELLGHLRAMRKMEEAHEPEVAE